MKCPVCNANYQPPALVCRRCGVDLAALIRLHDQAVWHHHQALQHYQAGAYAEAIAQTDQAIALQPQQADLHAFAGQLWAWQGQFDRAIGCWQTAQALDPQHPLAGACLAILQQLRAAPNQSLF
jgi:tetratricopeptide (TPR) repeat protein